MTTRIRNVPGTGWGRGRRLSEVAAGGGVRSDVGRYTVALRPSTAIVRAPSSVRTVCTASNLSADTSRITVKVPSKQLANSNPSLKAVASTVLSQKLNPDILVMQPTEN